MFFYHILGNCSEFFLYLFSFHPYNNQLKSTAVIPVLYRSKLSERIENLSRSLNM